MSTSTNKSSSSQRNRSRRKRQKISRAKGKPLRPAPSLYKPMLHVSPCTKAYLSSLVDPFGTAEQPCIPDVIILPSFKYRVTAKGTLTTSATTGIGFVAFSPWNLLANDAGQNPTGVDAGLVISTSIYTLNGIRWFNAGLQTGVAQVPSNSLFSTADLNSPQLKPQIRLVSAGVKIRYVGSNFRNQGSVTLYRGISNTAPDDPSIIIPIDYLKSQATSQVIPVSRKEEYLYYVPDSTRLIDYADYATYQPSAGSVDRHAYIIAVDGGDLDVPQSWAVEAVANFEIIGSKFPPSPSHGDAVGFSQALASIPGKAPIGSPKGVLAEAWKSFSSGFMDATTHVMNTAGSALPGLVQGVATSYFMGRAGNRMPVITDI